jgi:hypothetical protein
VAAGKLFRKVRTILLNPLCNLVKVADQYLWGLCEQSALITTFLNVFVIELSFFHNQMRLNVRHSCYLGAKVHQLFHTAKYFSLINLNWHPDLV